MYIVCTKLPRERLTVYTPHFLFLNLKLHATGVTSDTLKLKKKDFRTTIKDCVNWHFLGIFCLLDSDPSCGSGSKSFPLMWIHSAKKKKKNVIFTVFCCISYIVRNSTSFAKMVGYFRLKGIFTVCKFQTHLVLTEV